METRYILTSKQDKAFEHLISNESCSVLYGGAKGGGKSVLLCLWVYYWCKWLIEFYEIGEISFPLAVGFMGRKRSVDFEKTTFETWKRTIPASSYVIREQDKEVVIDGKVKVFFGGLDDQSVGIYRFYRLPYALNLMINNHPTKNFIQLILLNVG
jgi:hypothetical protein